MKKQTLRSPPNKGLQNQLCHCFPADQENRLTIFGFRKNQSQYGIAKMNVIEYSYTSGFSSNIKKKIGRYIDATSWSQIDHPPPITGRNLVESLPPTNSFWRDAEILSKLLTTPSDHNLCVSIHDLDYGMFFHKRQGMLFRCIKTQIPRECIS